jgi:hypothetical protein
LGATSGRAASLLRKSREMRQHASPSRVTPYKNICGAFLRAEFLSHEFASRAGYGSNHCAVSIKADPGIFGFHHVVRQGARLDDLEKARPVNYFSVRVNDDPVIRDKSSDAFEVILNDCLSEGLFEFQKFFFNFAGLHLPLFVFQTQSPRT